MPEGSPGVSTSCWIRPFAKRFSLSLISLLLLLRLPSGKVCKTSVERRLTPCYTSVKPTASCGTSDMKIEIKKIGNSDGLLLPRELMQRLDLKRGQQLHITELPGGGFQALPYDPDFERTMEIADEIMDKYRDTLAALAK